MSHEFNTLSANVIYCKIKTKTQKESDSPYSRCLRRNIKLHWFCLDCKINTRLLVLVHVILQLRLPELVEGDNDQGNEDVDEEEGEDDEVDDVEDGHLGAEEGDRRLVLERRRHRLLQHTA